MKQESSVPKECCYISLTNMPTPPPPPPAQMCVFLCVVYVFEMDDLHSLDMRSLWSFDATKSCARWGWALNLCQHPAWIPGPFSNSNTTCLCDCLLNKALIPQKPLQTGSPFPHRCHYESVEIKTQPQAGSQPNSANWLSPALFLWEAFDVSRGLLHSQWW